MILRAYEIESLRNLTIATAMLINILVNPMVIAAVKRNKDIENKFKNGFVKIGMPHQLGTFFYIILALPIFVCEEYHEALQTFRYTQKMKALVVKWEERKKSDPDDQSDSDQCCKGELPGAIFSPH